MYVLDTNVFISAMCFRGRKEESVLEYCLNFGQIVFSEATANELTGVILREKFDKYLLLEDREKFVQNILEDALVVTPTFFHTICRDPRDNMFLDVSTASDADFLITGDDDLLVLGNIGMTKILSPHDFLKEMVN